MHIIEFNSKLSLTDDGLLNVTWWFKSVRIRQEAFVNFLSMLQLHGLWKSGACLAWTGKEVSIRAKGCCG